MDDKTLKDLIARCNQGDQKAWQALIEHLTPLILSVCHKMQLSREESFDVFGQVSYILLHNLDKLKSPNKVISYVTTITRREVYAHERKARLYERVEGEAAELEENELPKTPYRNLEELEQSEVLAQAMSKLSPKEAALIRALFLDRGEPSYEEIACRVNIPVSSIGPTRSRSLAKLLRILKRMGYKFVVF